MKNEHDYRTTKLNNARRVARERGQAQCQRCWRSTAICRHAPHNDGSCNWEDDTPPQPST